AEALEVFDNLGAALWAEAAAAELARISGRTPASGSLTDAETRVASLVVEGLSNAEIAGRLFVSVRTVEAHLSRIYEKLGARSRVDVVRWASSRNDS
ncbi:MAG TPA: helix-turn-helix transcriptional regulator, partial [Candidatus Limnocylindrales bacterium]|nr:helix-turn-helix transcriptional regulator [Candidatus Limnocylindrales bacterium]